MTFTPQHFVVWAEIPVSDLDKAMTYYNTVLNVDLRRDETGPNPVAFFMTADFGNGIAGHLYEGKPAGDGTGPTVHLATPGKLEDTMKRVTKAGGKVISDPIQIPAGRFVYTLDPDGNSVGVFETV